MVPPEMHIHSITAVAPDADGRTIVVRADARVADQRTQLEIAVTTDLAPAMALALLASTVRARAERDELAPALDALAAAVVRSSSTDRLRLQLLFDHGAVLPIEMDVAAGRALSNGLVEYFGASERRFVRRKAAGAGGR